MKKIIITLCACFLVSGGWAQLDQGAKVVTASQTEQKVETTTDNGTKANLQFQVGLPFIVQGSFSGETPKLDPYNGYINFPWNVLYQYATFSDEDAVSFDVTKGYYGDKVTVNWDLKSNIDNIKNIKIYRRAYTEANNGSWGFLGTVPRDVSHYDDFNIDGGILYEYKVEADGIVGNEYLQKYITGIGFRSPTAVVTGNVNYDGGSPVEDVTITAEAGGSAANLGSALQINDNGFLIIQGLNNPIETAATMQAWIKPEVPYTNDSGNAIRLFGLKSGTKTMDVFINYLVDSKRLQVIAGNAIFNIQDYFPSGVINPRGEDELELVSKFNTTFTHVSVVLEDGGVPKLYINGRPMTAEYATLIESIEVDGKDAEDKTIKVPKYPTFTVSEVLATSDLSTTSEDQWNTIEVGGGRAAFIDEIRIWKAAISDKKIRTDYKRYINGNDSRLVSYLRVDEGLGAFAYDYSRDGIEFNKNHGEFVSKTKTPNDVAWVTGAGNIPAADQLGVLGVTDENGNYQIAAIPYSGTGESFTITPSYGLHQFEPNQKLVYLGEGSTVVNEINFVDKSSFQFKGVVLYDTRNVFNAKDIGENDRIGKGSSIKEDGYNTYRIGNRNYRKGEHWLNTGDDPDKEDDDYLDEYATVFVGGANIYIDGVIVRDENNVPEKTDEKDGAFTINVPIGNHYITVKKDGHVFEFNGRFPEFLEETEEPEDNLYEFVQDREDQVTFIDKTRVTVVGRVVGGAIEMEDARIGFGGGDEEDVIKGSFTNTDGDIEDVVISSKNNIGQATINFGYIPKGSSAATVNTMQTFSTNKATGAYRISTLPLVYAVLPNTGVRILSNDVLNSIIIENTINPDFSEIKDSIIPEYEYPDGTVEQGLAYQYSRDFPYRSEPELRVLSQTSDTEMELQDGSIVSTAGLKSNDGIEYPIYTQGNQYEIVLESFEPYINKDIDALYPVDKVPSFDGEFIINNNLAEIPRPNTSVILSEIDPDSNNSYSLILDPEIENRVHYRFAGGFPAITYPFVQTISIDYLIKGNTKKAKDLNGEGIVIGGKGDPDAKSFLTQAPVQPDIILRDPPGSNSFASIESGSSISITSSNALATTSGASGNVKILNGSAISFGGGIAGPQIKFEVINNTEIGVSLAAKYNNTQSITKTYTFNQTISTSDDPDWVGADADVYIGTGKNYYMSEADYLLPASNQKGEAGLNLKLVNNNGSEVYISKQEAKIVNPEFIDTFYAFSQGYILNGLIPEYQDIIQDFKDGVAEENLEEGFTQARYEEDILQWRKIILKNERSKYAAKYNRLEYKKSIDNVIDLFDAEIIAKIEGGSLGPLEQSNLIGKFEQSTLLRDVLDENWQKNISFDAGVGETTLSAETVVITETTNEINLTFDESIDFTVGGKAGGFGLVGTIGAFFQQDINATLNIEDTKTEVFSYTLKDNDASNLLSIDVINTFDGNGPIFSTLGGRTSCPYEGQENSNFFSTERMNTHLTSYFSLKKQLYDVVLQIPEAEEEANGISLLGPLDDNKDWDDYRALLSQKAELEESLKTLDNDLFESLTTPDIATAPLNTATQRVEVPELSIPGQAQLFGVPESQNAEFKLILENSSAAGIDADFLLIVEDNPNQALINIEPNGTIVRVPYGIKTEYLLTLGKSSPSINEYKDIKVILRSLCDGNDVSASVLVSATFVPSCSEVIVSAPTDKWVYNIAQAYNLDGTTNKLNIKLGGFNTSLVGFEKLDLEYRLATSPFWSKLQTYHTSEELYDADASPETEKSVIPSGSSELTYGFDIIDLGLTDATYEIRARSSCSNGTEFISEVVTGSVDLHAPQRFGTPLPIDGILGAGEDFKVSFNENISYNTAESKIVIVGPTNQLPINNNVSLYFEGADNTVTIEKPRIVTGDFSLEFWMNNPDVNVNATIFSQTDGLSINMVGGQLSATIGGITATGGINPDKLFHHYTITHNNDAGSLSIYEDDKVVAETTGAPNVQFGNSNTLVIGGNTFVGNIHDLRLWGKSLTLSNAYANIYTQIIGNEAKLLGYWPMSEGRGAVANDKAFFRHASVNADWDIKPKGNSYEFANGHYLELDKMGFAQLTNTMDATISFWIKTETGQESTIFSNGKGDGTDPVQTNGLTNKWAINVTGAGTLSFESEGTSYPLTVESVADNRWHHVTLLFNRLGSLRTYVDAEQVSSNSMAAIGGFSGNVALLGARLSIMNVIRDEDTNEILDIVYEGDRVFSGKIDEFRMWNTLRAVEQIDRDRFNEIDFQTVGLIMYARMNAPETFSGNGPSYHHTGSGENNREDDAVLKTGTVNYSDDVPAIKPARILNPFEVSYVINEDDMIFEPVVSDWAVLEGQVLDITVKGMLDAANNIQESPITWTAFIQQNTVSWYAEGFNEVVNLEMENGEEKTFNLVIINKGGVPQSYNIANVPNWMTLSSSSGNIPPDSQITVTATIDSQLSTGEYLENLSLQTDFGFDQKLQLELRVLGEEPDWSINPNDFDYSMNIIGKLNVNGIFSDDLLDKVVAFSNGEVRGVTNVIYNAAYQEYFVFLTVYSNTASGDPINFSIWDATQSIVMESTINGAANTGFNANGVIGDLVNATLFENTNVVEQQIVTNPGWTWISMHVNDPNGSNLNGLISNATLETDDRVLSTKPSLLETYFKDNANLGNSTWGGTLMANGGLTPNYMYKVYFENEQTLNLKGVPVAISSWNFPIEENWNWLPYPLKKNVSVNEALSLFDPAEGDVIKSQNLFAIYDLRNGWIGTLNYLEAGQGYMLKSSSEQTFKYSNIFAKGAKNKGSSQNDEQARIAPEFTKYSENMNAVVLLPEGYDELFVYDADGILKGQTKNLDVGDKALSFISIYGESDEAITFHVGNGQEQRATSKSISFKGNDVIGTVANPLILEEDVLGGLNMYPNPFSKDLILELYSKEAQPMGITLFNMVGQLVYSDERTLEKGNNALEISPQVSQGVYFLSINLKDVVRTYRVIKN